MVITLRSIDRRVGIVAALALVLVVAVAIGAAIVSSGGSDAGGASPGGEPPATSDTTRNGGGPTSRPTGEVPTTERPQPVEVRDPIGLTTPGDFGTGLVMKITRIASVQSRAGAPGDIAGPALRVELEATNASNDPISLEAAQVGLEYGDDRTPGSMSSGPDVKRFSRSLAPGKSSTAASVFRVPPDQRDRIRVVVSYSIDAPTIVFEGSGP